MGCCQCGASIPGGSACVCHYDCASCGPDNVCTCQKVDVVREIAKRMPSRGKLEHYQQLANQFVGARNDSYAQGWNAAVEAVMAYNKPWTNPHGDTPTVDPPKARCGQWMWLHGKPVTVLAKAGERSYIVDGHHSWRGCLTADLEDME